MPTPLRHQPKVPKLTVPSIDTLATDTERSAVRKVTDLIIGVETDTIMLEKQERAIRISSE